jgi:hypothetical protein
VHAEAGEADAGELGRVDRVAAEVEVGRVVADLAHAVGRDLVDLHRQVVIQPLVEELQLERQLVLGPKGVVGFEMDGVVLVVAQIGQFLRQLRLRLLVRRRRQLPGADHHVVEAEGLRRRQRQQGDRGNQCNRAAAARPGKGNHCLFWFETA